MIQDKAAVRFGEAEDSKSGRCTRYTDHHQADVSMKLKASVNANSYRASSRNAIFSSSWILASLVRSGPATGGQVAQ